MIFEDRHDAGRRLSKRLEEYRGSGAIVLAIPRGGVVVGYEVACGLDLPLDVVIPRKIGAPNQPELAIGAVAGEDVLVVDPDIAQYLGVSPERLVEEANRQRAEIVRRQEMYRKGKPPLNVFGKTVILVDDGVATGYTTIAAARELESKRPRKLVLAVPVAPPDTIPRLKREVDDLVVLETPEPFFAVGSWYHNFEQTTDEEVVELLQKAEELGKKPPP